MTFFPFFENYPVDPTALAEARRATPTSHAQALETLFKNFEFDFERVSSSIDSILTAPNRCIETSLYIQGIIGGGSAFLCTNLNRESALYVTRCQNQWCLGSSDRCGISIGHRQIAPEHALIHYHPSQGFVIADMGSESGTWINGKPLLAHRSRPLKDGDLIELGDLRIEFFVELCCGSTELN